MQTMTGYSILLLLLLLLAGCGGEPEPPVEKRGHVWQEQINTMDKARDVEGLLQGSAAAQRKEIDAQAQ
jgi:PBP1b-binding outer membrane lipoprotein LpoB